MEQHDPLEVIVVWASLVLLGLLLLSMAYGRFREWQQWRLKSTAGTWPSAMGASHSGHAADKAQATPEGASEAKQADTPQIIALRSIADTDNLLIVGPKGSGKTTLLQLLLTMRCGMHVAFDPHSAPGKWPCKVVGGGRQFGEVDAFLQTVDRDLGRRYMTLHEGRVAEGQFGRLTLVGDEWRAIAHELSGDRRSDRLGAGHILLKLLAEGRKVGLCVLAASHNDTAASMGMAGDMAMLACFDWIVYLGALAVRKMPAASQMPRPAVAYHSERDSYYLLDLPAIASREVSSLLRQTPTPTVPYTNANSEAIPEHTGTAVTHGTAHHEAVPLCIDDNDISEGVPALLTDEAIRILYNAWGSKNRVAALLQGTKSKRLAQIDAALASDLE